MPDEIGRANDRCLLAEFLARLRRKPCAFDRIGNALLEWMQYDADAQPLTISFADYMLPMATDVPTCTIAHVETVNPHNPLGVKGAGEGGTIPAPAAIVAAIEDALSPFGVHFAETPLTPERIVAAMRAAGAYERLFAG